MAEPSTAAPSVDIDAEEKSDFDVILEKTFRFLQENKGATAAHTVKQFVVPLVQALRGEVAELRADFDDLDESLDVPEASIIEEVEVYRRAAAALVIALAQKAGFLDAEKGWVGPPELQKLFGEFDALTASLGERLQAAIEDLGEDDDGDDGDDADDNDSTGAGVPGVKNGVSAAAGGARV